MSGPRTDRRPEAIALLDQVRRSLPSLEDLHGRCDDHWGFEDPIYRLYHGSWKVYALQQTTLEVVGALQSLAPDRALNADFSKIVADGTGKVFADEHNERWLEVVRPIVEAFFHARFFLQMAIRYGKQLDTPPAELPSGWAAFLYLYDLR